MGIVQASFFGISIISNFFKYRKLGHSTLLASWCWCRWFRHGMKKKIELRMCKVLRFENFYANFMYFLASNKLIIFNWFLLQNLLIVNAKIKKMVQNYPKNLQCGFLMIYSKTWQHKTFNILHLSLKSKSWYIFDRFSTTRNLYKISSLNVKYFGLAGHGNGL